MKNETIKIGQLTVDFLLESEDTNGSLAMFEFGVPAGAKVPVPHFHKHYDETVFGLEGILSFTVEGKTFDIAPGQSYFIPRGAVHGFVNLRAENARTLAVITPALLGPIFFRECSEIVNAGGPPDIEKLRIVMTRHGLVPVLPNQST